MGEWRLIGPIKEELSDLIGSIASEANHTKKKGLAAMLNEICDELESLEDELRYPKNHPLMLVENFMSDTPSVPPGGI